MGDKTKLTPKWEPLFEDGQCVKGFARYRPTGIIYYRQGFSHLGISELNAPTGERNLRKARKRSKILIEEHLKKFRNPIEQVPKPSFGKLFGEVVEEVLDQHTRKLRPKTQAQHKLILPVLKNEFGLTPANDITPAMLNTFIEKERNSERKEGQWRKRRETFGDFAKLMSLTMRWAYQNRYVTHLLKFPNPDNGRTTHSRVYTDDEIARLWVQMAEDMQDQFTLSYECFMRLGEVFKLTWERVDLEKGLIILRKEDVKTGSKTGKGRTFVVSPNALERLKARKERTAHIGSPYVFPARGQRDRQWRPNKPQWDNKTAWKFAKKNAKIEGRARWHDIRHTALTNALMKELNPLMVSEYAGVSLATIQKVYLHSKAEHTKQVSLALSIPVLTSSEKKEPK